MQVFVPYPEPVKVAECLDRRRLQKQIIECDQILNAISGEPSAWLNHPVVKMYWPFFFWLRNYRNCLKEYAGGREDSAEWWSWHANIDRPYFLSGALCDQHKRRLYTKAPALYPQFAQYGTSEENWYYVDGKILIYINGKQV